MRRLLCHEPRGHADMYGGFLVEPDDAGAELGVLFWHKDGFSTACGHGTIALAAWAVESGRVEAPADGEVELAIDVPSGRVGRARADGGRRGRRGHVPQRARLRARARGRGRDRARAARGRRLLRRRDLRVAAGVGRRASRSSRRSSTQLIALGREIKWALNDAEVARHPSDERLSGIYGTIFFDDLGPRWAAPAQRRDLRRRRGRPLAVRLGHLGARRAAGRRRPAAGRRRCCATTRSSAATFRARVVEQVTRRGPRRGRHGDRGQRAPDGRAPLRARPARPARRGVRAAMSAPVFHDAATIARALPHAAAVDALEAALRGRPGPGRGPAALVRRRAARRAAADALRRGAAASASSS